VPSQAARSPGECLIYLGFVPCAECGKAALEPTGFEPYQRVWAYEAECAECGAVASFRFEVIDPGQPSRLLDAGQFLVYAEQIGELIPAERDIGLIQPGDAVEELDEAIGAVREALRFVPDGADAVPREALWAPESLTRYDADPEMFGRRMLLALQATLRRLRADFS
jgi:hypothetical protein